MTSGIDWYFDFVSPYSYFGLHRLREFREPIALKPVLFAGLLNHWGQKGPAEIPGKRKWTYRSCQWWAAKTGLPFRFPALHPFNPLHHLRLALACGSEIRAVTRIFDSIWTSGADANDPARFSQLCQDLKVDPARLGAQEIKDQLRKNTEDAAARGVFGVPTFVINGEVFWGADSVEFAKAYLADPAIIENDEMRRLDDLPVAAARNR